MFGHVVVQKWTPIVVESFADLEQCEAEILDRIKSEPNGGVLYALHPLMMLEDVGVSLSEQVVAELKRREPRLNRLSPDQYLAMKEYRDSGDVSVRIHGLFRKVS